MDEMRESESCVVRLRKGSESQVEEREKTIKKLNTHATVPV